MQSLHYGDVITGAMASQITSLTIVYWTVCWGADLRQHQSSASLAFVRGIDRRPVNSLRGIHRRPVNSQHKGPVTRKMFPFDDIIMRIEAWALALKLIQAEFQCYSDQRKHQSSASLAFVRGIHRRPVNSPYKGPITRNMFLFDAAITNLAHMIAWLIRVCRF